ncbi:O-methyltransferase [Salinicoccus hispanicus]|uniref:Methyltransferase domain-containing protein n=1 Tax=Salinicoccus hispanicus TaxID=157225 RepID=A0A6N8U2B4_9STAP|nr:O-methyltransferase [Salinicoccus hispanicus]MXQ51106.1 methyltransferase domain-containing protein [Salinicoccus hispanicus]
MEETWRAVDEYFADRLVMTDDTMEHILKKNEEADMPTIEVSRAHGKMLHLMAKMTQAKTILEIGTHGGFSTVWLARALPEEGRMATLEVNPKHAEMARENLESAGVEDKVEVIEGEALSTLPVLLEKGYPRFDFIFIDADKENNAEYLNWALKLSKKGAIIIVDNVVRRGKIIEDTEEKAVPHIRRMFDQLAEDDRIETTAVQTVGQKGYDGFLMGVVK